jgi:hypothetical protein
MATTSIASPRTQRTWRDRVIGRARHIAVALLAPTLVLCIGVALTGAGERVLVAESVQSIPAIDGHRDAIWDSATPVTIPLRGGASGVPWLAMRALYDADRVFFLLEWPDPAESLERAPWEFTASGWRKIPPQVLYEDKAAIYWPISHSPAFEARGCTAMCHFSGGASSEDRAKGADIPLLSVGAHFMEREGEVADEWHWKAARSDPFDQLDDGYVNSDRPTPEHPKGGRYADEPSETGGGYTDNVADDGSGPPLDFPLDWQGQRLQLLAEDAVPIAPERVYETGHRVPSLLLAPFEGKRGEVEAKGGWRDGKWTLEIMRRRSTGDPHDVDFSDASRSYPFSVAIFNCQEYEHSYSLGVYWLRLK